MQGYKVPDFNALLALFTLKLLKKVGSSYSDIVCLPELWYTKIVTNFEREFDKIIDVAKEYNMVIIPWAFIERSNNNNGNDLYLLRVGMRV